MSEKTETHNGPSGREWGDLSREVTEIRHDLRTCRQIAVGESEVFAEFEKETRREIQDLKHELATITTKIYTTLSVVGVTASVVAFVITVVSDILD